MGFSVVRRMLGFEGGLCDRVRSAADELASTAKELKESVAVHQRAPDPFASMLGTMWNNHEVAKFPDRGVDIGKSRVYRRAPSS